MTKLPLAVDIADTVLEASESTGPLDVDAAADQLLRAHPEAEASRDEIVEVLTEEAAAAGSG
jgi:hypothetical protein